MRRTSAARVPRLLAAATVALLALACAGCSPDAASSGSDSPGAGASGNATPTAAAAAATSDPAVLAGSAVTATLAQLPQRSVAAMPAVRLADGLVPPTNRWFSGLVFGTPQAVFPLPLSFALTASGFAFGLPQVTSTANTIAGGFRADVTIDAGASSSRVVGYDDVSVTVALLAADGATIGTVLLAEGSPFVTFRAARDVTLGSSVAFAGQGDGLATATVGATGYGATATTGSAAGASVAVAAGTVVRWFPVPDGGNAAAVAAAAPGYVTGVTTGYAVAGGAATTSLRYRTSGGATVVGVLPHQASGLATTGCTLGSYATAYGTMKLCRSSTLRWAVPALTPSDRLDLGTLSAAERRTLITQVRADAARTVPMPTDTYGAGKALYRLANLLQLADQLGLTTEKASLQHTLRAQLDAWTSPQRCATDGTSRCFVYDPAAKGVVGVDASFGSDQFNDHHFHYGYFLYAAAVLVTVDPSSEKAIAPVLNAVAADLAANRNAELPTRRTFDPYAGHSWASGYAPFGDGNDQESSSEAVNAWNGLALWAQATGQDALASEAQWMLSAEAASATSYQVYPDLDSFDGFEHRVVGIDWGGKRDFATWFSADPVAVLGIQLIPMSPVAGYLAAPASQIAANVASVAPSGTPDQLADYLLMYRALSGGQAAKTALREAVALPEDAIDAADSRAYLTAFIAAHGG